MNFSWRSGFITAVVTTALQASVAQGLVSEPVLNPANGHYYSLVVGRGHTFAAALADAATMSHLGIPGHLATITSQAEQGFLNTKIATSAPLWIAASDAAVEGEWRWVAGPETGQLFWLGDMNGTAFGYESWGRSRNIQTEPNNLVFSRFGPDEDYASATMGSDETRAHWNDLADPPRDGGLAGYILEFSTVPEPSAWAMIAVAYLAGHRAFRGRLRPAQ